MTLAGRLADFAAELGCDDVPPEVRASVKERILDTIGIALAATPLLSGRAAADVARAWGGPPEATPIGFPGKLPAGAAAFVNGTLAHSLDFDDTHLPSILHPSAVIVPAALAQAEATRADGGSLVAAAAAGYEIVVRLGSAAYDDDARNNAFFERGFHATSICGTLAAAVVAAKLLGLGRDEIEHAVGLAASMGAGVLEGNRTGGSVKHMHCGWAAHAGLVAAQLAAAGFTGPPTVLEGRFGFFNAFCDGRFEPDAVVGGLGETWETPRIFFKPYPANHFTHAGIDAALALRADGLDPGDVARIDLGVAAPTLRTIAEPREQKVRPPTGYAAQFSGPFTVAAALFGGGGLGLYLDDFTDARARDPERLALASRVHCHAEPEFDAVFPHAFPAVLRVTTRSGRVLERRILDNRGGPEQPLTEAELALKFRLNASRVLTPEQCDRLQARCASLDHLDRIDDLTTTWEGR